MTAKELIDALSRYAPDTPIMVEGYEGGYDDLESENMFIIGVKTNRHVGVWIYGDHEHAEEEEPDLYALVLHRKHDWD